MCRADVEQPKGKDQWLDGFQHSGKPRHFVAPWDGRIFFVQNEAGKAKWPITPALIEELLEVFHVGYFKDGLFCFVSFCLFLSIVLCGG